MKIIYQFGIILSFWMLGEGLNRLLLPIIQIPGAIIGMIFIAAALSTGLLKEHHIKDIGDLLLNNISFFFVPASVGIIALSGVTGTLLGKLLLIALISTFTTMLVTMWVTHICIQLRRKKS